MLIRQPGTPASKARPHVIIQHDSTLDAAPKVTVCPLTSQLRGAESLRPFVLPDDGNGLHKPSEVEFDWIYTYPSTFVAKRIGSLDDVTMTHVDEALSLWLDL